MPESSLAKYIKVFFAFPTHVSLERLIVVHHRNKFINLYTFYTVPEEQSGWNDTEMFKNAANMVANVCEYKESYTLLPVKNGYYAHTTTDACTSSGICGVYSYYVPRVRKFVDMYALNMGSVTNKWSSYFNRDIITVLKATVGPTIAIWNHSPKEVRKYIKYKATKELQYQIFKRSV